MRNPIQRRTKLAAAALVVFAIAGCASLGALGGFSQPVVNFKDLRIRGLGLTGGSIDARFTVQDKDSTTVRIPIDFTYAGIGNAARSMMQSGSVPYTVDGDVTV